MSNSNSNSKWRIVTHTMAGTEPCLYRDGIEAVFDSHAEAAEELRQLHADIAEDIECGNLSDYEFECDEIVQVGGDYQPEVQP